MGYTVIGKIVEMRLTGVLSVTRDMTRDQIDRISKVIRGFNERSPGNFMLQCGTSEDEVTEDLRLQLVEYLQHVSDLRKFLLFRVNFNKIEADGKIWEGFSIGSVDWLPVELGATAEPETESKRKWVRKCQECGNVQESVQPPPQEMPPSGQRGNWSRYADAKCKKCKSSGLDYGKFID